MTRQDIINRLVRDDIDSIRQGMFNEDFAYISDILKDGHVGYKYYTDEQLRDEYNHRFDEEYYDDITEEVTVWNGE